MLAPGERLGPYEIASRIGCGGMGEVYRARDTRLSRYVALKVLPDAVASDPARRRRFEREAQAAAALSHPNILSVFDVGSDGGRPFLVSELLEGTSLGARLREGPIPVHEALSIAAQTARGLAAAHARGIVHRDIKPENLFLTTAGIVKVLDLGLARLSREARGDHKNTTAPTVTSPGAVLGTVRYMSPEQAKGRAADSRSDIFSLGMVIPEMISGRHPFVRTSSAETLSAILHDEPALDGVPPLVAQVVRRCLEKDPEQRFQSARDLEFALSTLSGLSADVAPVTAVAAKPRRRLVATLMVLIVVAAGGLGLLAGRTLPQPNRPSFQRLTFRRGTISGARFASDGKTVVYGARWDGQPCRLYTTRVGSSDSRPLDLPDAELLSISKSDEMAILVKMPSRGPRPLRVPSIGTLALVPLAGGAPREILADVRGADFSPDGRDLAVVRQAGSGRRLEYPVGKVLLEADGLVSPRVSPSGDLVAVSDDQGLIVVDRRGKQIAALTNGFHHVWSPGGDELWFARRDGTGVSLFAFSLSGRTRRIASTPYMTLPLDVSIDGRVLVTTGDLRAGILALVPGAASERDVSWLDQSDAVELSSDGRLLLFNEGGMIGGPLSIYLRTTDGTTPAVRLGEGNAVGLSHDHRWALTTKRSGAWMPELILIPTGAGASRVLKGAGIEYLWAVFFPDSKRILAIARQAGHNGRAFVQDIQGGPPRPLLPEDVSGSAISPDGELVAATDDATKKLRLWPVDGGTARPVAGPPEPGVLWSFSHDGRALYCVEQEDLVMKIFRRDLATGRRELVREVTPADRAGISQVGPLVPADEGKWYAYTYRRFLSSLYLVEGLR